MKAKKYMVLLLVILINIALDQGTKLIVKKNLSGAPKRELAGGIVKLTYTENTGAFLGLGSKLPKTVKRILLILLPGAAVIGAVIYFLLNGKIFTLLQLIAAGCFIGGGLSNLFDRIARDGRVIDFLNIGIGKVRTGIFNVADLSIMFGAIILIVSLLRKTPEGW